MRRRLVMALMGAVFASVTHAAALSPQPSLPRAASAESGSLRNIAGWLQQHGAEGFIGADVADAMGIPRQASEELLEARQRGFRSEEALRIAQVPADATRDFILFMVQRPDDEVYFYFSSVREGLKKAFVSIPSRNLVLPLEPLEAELRFRHELRYWGERIEPN